MQNLQQQQPALQAQQQQSGFAAGSMGGMQPAVPPAGSAAQELRLHVPTIGARLDSRQFEVLMDVIQNIAMAPLPTVCGRNACACVCLRSAAGGPHK